MKFIFSFFIFSFLLIAAPPDCSYSYRFTNISGDSVDNKVNYAIVNGNATTISINNIGSGCNAWIFSYDASGFSSLTISLQGAPNVGTISPVAGTYSAFPGTVISGANPSSNISYGSYSASGYVPFLNIALMGATGVGGINISLVGWKSTNFISSNGNLNTSYTSQLFSGISKYALINFRLAYNKVLLGLSDAKILAIGDSTTFGTGSTVNGPLGSWIEIFNNLFVNENRLITIQDGLAIPPAAGQPDTRWNIPSGCFVNTGYSLGNNSLLVCQNLTSNVVFTPSSSYSYDRYTIYYVCFIGEGGTFTATATGGTPVVTNTGAGCVNNTFSTVTVSSATLGANSVTISIPGAYVDILGIEPYVAEYNTIRFGNAGAPGSTTAGWVTNYTYGSLQGITTYAPNLCIIMLGINDALQNYTNAQYTSNMQTLINTCKTTGDIILMSFVPTNNTSVSYNTIFLEQQFENTLKSLAASNNIPLIDIYGSFNGVYQTPFMNSAVDGVHPNSLGYADIALTLNSFFYLNLF